jgi:hypothetical protein
MLEKAGRILAFGGLIPARLCLPSGETVGSATVIDWAAEPSAPGAGIALLSKLARKVDTLFVVGGAPATRRILPQIGFRSGGIVRAYSKWVRPWKEFRLRPLVPPSVLRLVHGLMHSFDRKPTSGGWDCVPIREFDPSFRGLLDGLSRPVTFVRRTVEDLNYMLRCPVVEMRGFLLRRRGAIAGYFIFGKAGWEGRIVDLFIDSTGVNDWSLAYAAAAETIGREPEVCRIFAWATQQLGELLEENGFWRQEEKPVLVRDPNNLLARAFPLALQMFDIDAAYFTN